MKKQGKKLKDETQFYNHKGYIKKELQYMNALIKKSPNSVKILRKKTKKQIKVSRELLKLYVKKALFLFCKIQG